MTISYPDDKVSEKTIKSFARIDAMNPTMRALVHEYGEPIVQACILAGVRQPRQIRQLVREIWEGARQPAQRRPAMGSLDWVLAQAGAGINAKTLVRILRDNSHYIVPIDPTTHMINASLREVSGFNVRVTKEEKHRRRLRAAIKAGVRHIWPDLD